MQQPFPGVYVWRDPHGAMYLVDHTGSCRLGQSQEPASRAEVFFRAALALVA